LLSNPKKNISVIPEEKKLQTIAQNETHISIVTPCSSEVLDESGNTFRIEGPYILDCNESRRFPYIDQVQIWRGQKCCNWTEIPSDMIEIRQTIKVKQNNFGKCGLSQNHLYCSFYL
jgi:hypothetical protein